MLSLCITQHTSQTWSWQWPQAAGSEQPEPRWIRSTGVIRQKTSVCLRHPPKPGEKSIWTAVLYCGSDAVHHIYRTTVPVGSPCVWAQAALCSLAAGTRSRLSAGSDKHSPNHCHPYDPACSGGSCRSPGPSRPRRKTHKHTLKKRSYYSLQSVSQYASLKEETDC